MIPNVVSYILICPEAHNRQEFLNWKQSCPHGHTHLNLLLLLSYAAQATSTVVESHQTKTEVLYLLDNWQSKILN